MVQWLVQRFRSERLRVRSRRSATFTPSAHVRRQCLPVWPERFSKPNIRFGSGRTGSKIVSKFRLTHNRKLRSANRNTIYHTCPTLLLWCLAVENRGPQVSQRMFFVKLCKSGGLLLPSPRSLVIPWPTPLAHSFTDDGHVPAKNLLPK